jgi:hypothetical protein
MKVVEDVVPTANAPTTLMEWAVLILNTPNPMLKVRSYRPSVVAISKHAGSHLEPLSSLLFPLYRWSALGMP